jgi:hypothetical protein
MLEHGGAWDTSLSLALPKDHQYEFSQPHEDALTPTWSPKTEQMQCYAITTMHWCTSLTNRLFFQKKDFCQSFNDGSFC